MLARMWRIGNPLALLVGMQTGAAILENRVEVPQKIKNRGAPGWRSRLSVRLQPGHDLAVCEFEPRVRLWADGSEPGACFRFCVCLSLCPSPVHALSLSVPKINKRWKKKIELPYDPAIARLGIYPKDLGVLIHSGTCTPMFIAVLSQIAKLWKEPKCPSTDE